MLLTPDCPESESESESGPESPASGRTGELSTRPASSPAADGSAGGGSPSSAGPWPATDSADVIEPCDVIIGLTEKRLVRTRVPFCTTAVICRSGDLIIKT